MALKLLYNCQSEAGWSTQPQNMHTQGVMSLKSFYVNLIAYLTTIIDLQIFLILYLNEMHLKQQQQQTKSSSDTHFDHTKTSKNIVKC